MGGGRGDRPCVPGNRELAIGFHTRYICNFTYEEALLLLFLFLFGRSPNVNIADAIFYLDDRYRRHGRYFVQQLQEATTTPFERKRGRIEQLTQRLCYSGEMEGGQLAGLGSDINDNCTQRKY